MNNYNSDAVCSSHLMLQWISVLWIIPVTNKFLTRTNGDNGCSNILRCHFLRLNMYNLPRFINFFEEAWSSSNACTHSKASVYKCIHERCWVYLHPLSAFTPSKGVLLEFVETSNISERSMLIVTVHIIKSVSPSVDNLTNTIMIRSRLYYVHTINLNSAYFLYMTASVIPNSRELSNRVRNTETLLAVSECRMNTATLMPEHSRNNSNQILTHNNILIIFTNS